MKKYTRGTLCALLGLGALGARAEGIRVYGLSAEAQTRGEAVAASGKTSGSAWYNPALLTDMERQASLDLDNLFVDATYTNAAGQSYDSQRTYFLVPAASVALPFAGGRWAFGFNINSPFGVATEYDKESSFNYITTGGEVTLVSFNPNLAWRVSDKLSLAAGAMYYKSEAEINQQYKWSALGFTGAPDGSLKLSGSGDGWGGDVGFLWKPAAGHALGISYRSQVVVKLDEGDAELTNRPAFFGGGTYTVGAQTTISYPDIVNVGYAFRPGVDWRVEIGGQWVNWTDFDQVAFHMDQQTPYLGDSALGMQWKNAWSARLGVEYVASETLALDAGYFFDKTPTRQSTYSPLVPDGDHHVLSAGARWRVGPLDLTPGAVLVLQTSNKTVTSERTDNFGQNQTTSGNYDMLGYKLAFGASYRF